MGEAFVAVLVAFMTFVVFKAGIFFMACEAVIADIVFMAVDPFAAGIVASAAGGLAHSML